ncbi:AAA family ATPase [Rhodococcus hoagii]|nr:AAA family ATPase [Prescottella equi]
MVLVDCPPSVGKLVSNALIAATGFLIVTEPSIDASAGVANVMDSIETVREHYNPDLEVLGVVLNKVPPRSREADFRAPSSATPSATGSGIRSYRCGRSSPKPAAPAIRSTPTAAGHRSDRDLRRDLTRIVKKDDHARQASAGRRLRRQELTKAPGADPTP